MYFCLMSDEFYMQRCLDLARLGLGYVSPNPMVGCVIVHENEIIGEGYHQRFGEAHAEVNAINDVLQKHGNQANSLLENATVYVNLEPCAHFGKTPPCADLLIKHQVKRVVIGNTDPFSEVNGKGIEKLKSAGIQVKIGILEDECTYLNRRFFCRINNQRPYIILKWAATADGYFAPENGTQRWITDQDAKAQSLAWRGEEDAILVGKNTVLADNPLLTNRSGNGRNPVRIVIDRNLNIPEDYQVFNDEAKTIVFNEIETTVKSNIHYVQLEDMHFYLPQKIAFQLFLMDIQSVIIEGGINILEQFIAANLWDEARVFRSKNTWTAGRKEPLIVGKTVANATFNNDMLTILTPLNR